MSLIRWFRWQKMINHNVTSLISQKSNKRFLSKGQRHSSCCWRNHCLQPSIAHDRWHFWQVNEMRCPNFYGLLLPTASGPLKPSLGSGAVERVRGEAPAGPAANGFSYINYQVISQFTSSHKQFNTLQRRAPLSSNIGLPTNRRWPDDGVNSTAV